MILTVTANPLLDRYLRVAEIQRGTIHRGESVDEWVGGKGVNVSRAVLALGGDTLATGFLGGYTGERIRELLDAENIAHEFISIRTVTRQGLSLWQPDAKLTAFYDPPAPVSKQEITAFIRRFPHWLDRADFCVIAGSMPGPEHADFYARLIAMCKTQAVPVLLDTYGTPLQHSLPAGADFIKVNREEVLHTFPEVPFDQRMDVFVRKARNSGTAHILITDGEGPCRLFSHDETVEFQPPAVHERNALGSGDCTAAGIACALLDGMFVERAVVIGLAAGAANAETLPPAAITPERVHQLAREVTLMVR